MKVELFERLIQVSIEKDSYFERKARHFVQKHFPDFLRLSNSILVLETRKNHYKKNYFLNWVYHVCIHMDENSSNVDFDTLIQHSDLPIRIKFVDKTGVVEHVHVSMRFISQERISLNLDKQSRLARRYLISTFRDHMVGYGKKELFLDNTRPSFWEKLMTSMTEKIIFNVALKFDYDQWKIDELRLGSMQNTDYEGSSYLTQEEKRLRRSYAILECGYHDPMESVRSRYLSLAREYHPDNVYGQDQQIIDSYAEKFRMIQEAFETIKQSYRLAA